MKFFASDYESQLHHKLRERQNAFEAEFARDLDAYRMTGETSRSRTTSASSASLLDVNAMTEQTKEGECSMGPNGFGDKITNQ
jgi:hypothetical protein